MDRVGGVSRGSDRSHFSACGRAREVAGEIDLRSDEGCRLRHLLTGGPRNSWFVGWAGDGTLRGAVCGASASACHRLSVDVRMCGDPGVDERDEYTIQKVGVVVELAFQHG